MKDNLHEYHRFLDEAGDTTFYGKGKIPILGKPNLSIADYFCWAVQRIFEIGETRFYDYIFNKISFVIDLYDTNKFENELIYYKKGNPLTDNNKISP